MPFSWFDNIPLEGCSRNVCTTAMDLPRLLAIDTARHNCSLPFDLDSSSSFPDAQDCAFDFVEFLFADSLPWWGRSIIHKGSPCLVCLPDHGNLSAMPPIIINPYADLSAGNWVRGNLHAHTTASDGKLLPQELVDAYAKLGY